MKKLAYIILVIAILVVISHFVKQGSMKPTAEQITPETSATLTEDSAPISQAMEEISSSDATISPTEDNDVVDVQENIEDIIIEENVPEDDGAIDVEETNPEETIDEEETIIKE